MMQAVELISRRSMPRKPLSLKKTGKAAKTHQGVQSEFHRLARDEPHIDKAFAPFLNQSYNLKAVADDETGPDLDIPLDHSAAAIETAERFVNCMAELLAQAGTEERNK